MSRSRTPSTRRVWSASEGDRLYTYYTQFLRREQLSATTGWRGQQPRFLAEASAYLRRSVEAVNSYMKKHRTRFPVLDATMQTHALKQRKYPRRATEMPDLLHAFTVDPTTTTDAKTVRGNLRTIMVNGHTVRADLATLRALLTQ